MSLDSSHVKLSASCSHEWIRQCCYNGDVELENKVLSEREIFVKVI